ncbi:MAG TPA: SpoIIE family protein phosphatase [Actinomycetota bacterium]|nr:SpoIIE family protein phosphatase [Actinomycetota bacterium]
MSAGNVADELEPPGPGPSVLARLVVAMVIAGVVTGALGSWLIARSAGRALKSEIDLQNEALSTSLATRLDDRIDTRISILRTVATRAGIEEMGESAQSELNVVLKALPEIDRLLLYDIHGVPVAASSATRLVTPESVAARPDLVNEMAPGAVKASLIEGQVPMVELAVAVQNPPGTVLGVLVAELPLDEVASHLEELQTGESRIAFLVQQDGKILVHPERDRVVSGERLDPPGIGTVPNGSFSGRGADQVRYLFAGAPSTTLPVSVVVRQGESEALASVSASTRNLSLILLAVMVVTVVTVAVVGRLLLAPLRSMVEAARSIGRGEKGARIKVRGYGEVGRLGRELNRMAEALELRIAELEERKVAEVALREQSRLAETLFNVGTVLTAELDLEEVVQAVTNIATDLTGAQFGAFFYNVIDRHGESYMLYSLAGVDREAFSSFPMPRNTDVFGPTFRGERTVRSDDITKDPHYGRNEPYHGMPEGHLPVRSYLAVPVVSRRGEVLGGLFFGHEVVGVFTEGHERLTEGIAAQAAVAIENARLYAAQRSAAETLQRSLLPATLPVLPGIELAARYLPAEPGVEVGGDWYDVITLPNGKVAVVVGDVVGRGIPAAGIMGQLCHAVRAYAVEDPAPGSVLARLNRFLCDTGVEEQFATVVFAVFDPEGGTLRFANAGHPPPLRLNPEGTACLIERETGLPIGALPGSEYDEEEINLPPGSRLVLYTDGLVEDRNMALNEGLERLRLAATEAPSVIEAFCDYVADRLTEGRDVQDDIAILAVGPVKA